MKRTPSCLISYAHSGPVGTMRLSVGKQGSMKGFLRAQTTV
jgi:hypothetical protein